MENYTCGLINKNTDKKCFLVNGQTIYISKREFQCLKLLAHGKRIKEIARRLKISHRTVPCHLELFKRKTGCDNHEKLVDFYWTYLEPKVIDI